jgi:hypothetical protein
MSVVVLPVSVVLVLMVLVLSWEPPPRVLLLLLMARCTQRRDVHVMEIQDTAVVSNDEQEAAPAGGDGEREQEAERPKFLDARALFHKKVVIGCIWVAQLYGRSTILLQKGRFDPLNQLRH